MKTVYGFRLSNEVEFLIDQDHNENLSLYTTIFSGINQLNSQVERKIKLSFIVRLSNNDGAHN